jgi:hypothetical protein
MYSARYDMQYNLGTHHNDPVDLLEIKNRVKVVEKLIKIANHCLKLNNYNTALAIVSGLNLVSVSRLKATWEVKFDTLDLD